MPSTEQAEQDISTLIDYKVEALKVYDDEVP